MKVSNIKDVEKFFEVVDSCTGRVELVTGEGDRQTEPQIQIIPVCISVKHLLRRRDPGT